MRLEFKKDIVPDHIFKELEFENWLNEFYINIPFYPLKVLAPMEQNLGARHFLELSELRSDIKSCEINYSDLFSKIKALPNLEQITPFFKNKTLEQYHFYIINQYIETELELDKIEDKFRVSGTQNLNQIKSILSLFMVSDCSSFRPDLIPFTKRINELEAQIKSEINELEKLIEQETGLIIRWPLPHKLSEKEQNSKSIRNCSSLILSSENNQACVKIRVPDTLKSLQQEKDQLTKNLEAETTKLLNQLNQKLEDCYPEFEQRIESRKHRIFQYILLQAAKQLDLVIPGFNNVQDIDLKEARLPALEQNSKKTYIPLDIKLQKGSNVLFGANMTGKTTVLKTLYFMLTCIRFGLPIPAKTCDVPFPEHLFFHLKNSGDIQSNVSSFGDECKFFAREFPENSIVISDELFQSTDPMNGVKLSRIFLEHFEDKNIVFFCTSHYPQVLQIEGLKLFQMLDMEFEDKMQYDLHIEDLLTSLPYRLERVTKENANLVLQGNRKPLEVALYFDFPKQLKSKIIDELKG
jgi:DNA mismatch repair ATPase MutS